jgi:hypothetical protein
MKTELALRCLLLLAGSTALNSLPSGRVEAQIGSDHVPGRLMFSVPVGGAGLRLGLSTGPGNPTVGSDGSVYIADRVNHRVVRYSATGAHLADYPVSASADALFVDDDTLWVLNGQGDDRALLGIAVDSARAGTLLYKGTGVVDGSVSLVPIRDVLAVRYPGRPLTTGVTPANLPMPVVVPDATSSVQPHEFALSSLPPAARTTGLQGKTLRLSDSTIILSDAPRHVYTQILRVLDSGDVFVLVYTTHHHPDGALWIDYEVRRYSPDGTLQAMYPHWQSYLSTTVVLNQVTVSETGEVIWLRVGPSSAEVRALPPITIASSTPTNPRVFIIPRQAIPR